MLDYTNKYVITTNILLVEKNSQDIDVVCHNIGSATSDHRSIDGRRGIFVLASE